MYHSPRKLRTDPFPLFPDSDTCSTGYFNKPRTFPLLSVEPCHSRDSPLPAQWVDSTTTAHSWFRNNACRVILFLQSSRKSIPLLFSQDIVSSISHKVYTFAAHFLPSRLLRHGGDMLWLGNGPTWGFSRCFLLSLETVLQLQFIKGLGWGLPQ